MKGSQFWFTSTLFDIEPGEDRQTNPLRYGKQLATWLRQKLIEGGYTVEEVGPEDWGWYLMCARKPFRLFVGCVSVHNYAKSRPEDPPPLGKDVTWTCVVNAELPLSARLFGRVDPTPAVENLSAAVGAILRAEPCVVFTERP